MSITETKIQNKQWLRDADLTMSELFVGLIFIF